MGLLKAQLARVRGEIKREGEVEKELFEKLQVKRGWKKEEGKGREGRGREDGMGWDGQKEIRCQEGGGRRRISGKEG